MFEQLNRLINKCGHYAQVMECGETREIRHAARILYEAELRKLDLIRSLL